MTLPESERAFEEQLRSFHPPAPPAGLRRQVLEAAAAPPARLPVGLLSVASLLIAAASLTNTWLSRDVRAPRPRRAPEASLDDPQDVHVRLQALASPRTDPLGSWQRVGLELSPEG